MNITPVSIYSTYKMASFKSSEKTPTPKKETQEVQYSTWGDNYAYPVSKDSFDVNKTGNKEDKIIDKLPKNTETESPEEYYKRKLYSTEWTM